jgi:hypothetical protein
MKTNGEFQESALSSDEIKAGSKVMMTHAQRQAFMKISRLGQLFGVAHLLPEVEASVDIEYTSATKAKAESLSHINLETP